jgi:arsenate reductase (glutaredoxin)
MTIRLHGIPNCDTVKRARAFLADRGVPYQFIDFKKAGVADTDLQRWAAAVGWPQLLNRQGTTWRKLDAATQAEVVDEAAARRLMQAQTSAIKRPVVEWPDGSVSVGFTLSEWEERLQRSIRN